MTIALWDEVAIFFAAILFSFVVYASFFEWILHKHFMHRKVKIGSWVLFSYPFEAHALVHHRVFQADNTYHVQRKEDEHLIPMAWWNGIVLVLVGMIPFIILCLCIGHWIVILSGIGLGCATYYAAYETMHWCMHKPLVRRRLVEHLWFFRRLNGHHVLHHRHMGKNYNVVLPLWDFLFGTLMIRSPNAFPQVQGHSVPNVQPQHSEKTRWMRPK